LLWGYQDQRIGELPGVRVTDRTTDREPTSSPWGHRQFSRFFSSSGTLPMQPLSPSTWAAHSARTSRIAGVAIWAAPHVTAE